MPSPIFAANLRAADHSYTFWSFGCSRSSPPSLLAMALCDDAAAHVLSRCSASDREVWVRLWPRIQAEVWRRIHGDRVPDLDPMAVLAVVLGRPAPPIEIVPLVDALSAKR